MHPNEKRVNSKRSIEIRMIIITAPEVDAIVNVANEGLRAGCEVCSDIYAATGFLQLQEACKAN